MKTSIDYFYSLSLPVKNMNNLNESLDNFVAGEIINEFKCDSCLQSVDIEKKCSFVSPPNYMMFHLQKIYFDLNTFTNSKMCDKYEFPPYLDLKKYYIKEIMDKYGIVDPNVDAEMLQHENDSFEYRLIGVVIHSGVADGGHYYSLVNTEKNA